MMGQRKEEQKELEQQDSAPSDQENPLGGMSALETLEGFWQQWVVLEWVG